MIKSLFRPFLTVILLVAFTMQAHAHNGTFIGLLGNKLVAINTETAQMRLFQDLVWPEGQSLENLIYEEKSKAFFTIADAQNAPKLLRLEEDGKVNTIGAIKINGQPVSFCGGLTYSPDTETAYISIDAEGDDQIAETLLEIDLSTGHCNVTAKIRGGSPGNDFEGIGIYKDILYVIDNAPSLGISYVFTFPLARLDGEIRAGSMQNLPLKDMQDVLATNYMLYFADDESDILYAYNIRSQQLMIVGRLNYGQFGGRHKLSGLALIPSPRA